jgi:pyruvate ferredoxin oxidoreductase delta subunit
MGTRDCRHICDESSPGIGEAGKTGEWRTVAPRLDDKKCTVSRLGKPTCFLCWLYCPEAIIAKGIPPSINLEYCKGCGICANVCPVQAITMVAEEKHIGQL